MFSWLQTDDDPDSSFKDVVQAFVDPFKPPPTGFVVHKTKKYKTGVFLAPGKGKTGALEHLLLEAATLANPDALKCREDFRHCVKTTTDWSSNKQAKMKLACYICLTLQERSMLFTRIPVGK